MSKSKTPAERSAVVSASGMMAGIWFDLLTAVRAKGGSDEAIYRLNTPEGKPLIERMADLIVWPFNYLVWTTVFSWILALCRFTFVNHNITAENFPLQKDDLMVKEVFDIAIPRSMTTKEVLAFLDEQGYRAATFVELLYWWLANPDKQLVCMVVALGYSVYNAVPYIEGCTAKKRHINLMQLHERGIAPWGTTFRFAAVRKPAPNS